MLREIFNFSLEPYSLYTVTVYAINGAGAGNGESVNQRTGESSKRLKLDFPILITKLNFVYDNINKA